MNKAFLSVESSITGRRWVGPGPEVERMSEAISQRAGLPDAVARVLAARGVPPEEAAAWLEPRLRDLTPDPSTLRDMDLAAERLADAVERRERVALFGDYDVDGAASSAMVARWLRALGVESTVYIPDRIDEGYGPNVPAMTQLAERHSLIVCLDCGTLSHEPIAAAVAKGAQVMVVDHHLAAETLPPALAVVNPNRQDEDGALGHLCAAGVAFLLLIAANRALRGRGAKKLPDLMQLVDLAALATVADVAPLIGWNRALVRQGLAVMARRGKPGLAALADAARLNAPPGAYHLGYVLGPRINAGGRIGASDLGARLLSTDDPHEAEALAARLEALNAERRAIEAQVLEAAAEQAEARGVDGPLAWAAGQGWHPGVLGIVAARLKERYNRPAVVIGLAEGVGAGSGRSVAGVDLGSAVAALAREGLLVKGGGHRMAAGLTVREERLDEAMARLSEKLARQGAGAQGPRDLRLDGALTPGGATVELIETLERAGPFGQGAPAPRFAFPAVEAAFVKTVGEGHLRATLRGPGGARLDAIAFRAFDGPLGPFLSGLSGAPAHVAGRLEIDDWGGRRKPKLRIEDAAPVR
ncbi:single-stranded-DNA-specific exonuclease RecJ [Oceanicella actignis]|uniref:Single-stranded-DNA-specific exonuclease RecJ n=1 Tax=Oceanicella actignis TaxID=1189325 RepID=A0A1M7SRB1_9RHOB|nr:single-stranded-DNA-specific exonuclease RecJ [Oceanicella actignis]SES67547.1 exonuclease RecJ [Oceanicella actignis]SHN60992.1 single-stranded-DNA-specific exonuclease [Oceanicella actignis]